MTEEKQTTPVKRSKRRIWLAAVVVTLVVAGGFVLIHRDLAQPTYQNKSLAYWFEQLPVTFSSVRSTNTLTYRAMAVTSGVSQVGGITIQKPKEKAEDVANALESMRRAALPFLLAKMERRDSSLKNWIQKCANKIGIKKQLFEDPVLARGRAVTGLIYLGSLPDDALPKLRKLSTNSNFSVASSAQIVLSDLNGYLRPIYPNNSLIILQPDRSGR